MRNRDWEICVSRMSGREVLAMLVTTLGPIAGLYGAVWLLFH